jgi:hypothetical protein
MIDGFGEQTHDLTDWEMETLLPLVITGLAVKYGKEMAVTNKVMVSKLKVLGYKTSGPRIRKLINHIRVTGMIPGLLASSQGYWVSTDPDEILTFIGSLEQRASAILAVKQALIKQLQDHVL